MPTKPTNIWHRYQTNLPLLKTDHSLYVWESKRVELTTEEWDGLLIKSRGDAISAVFVEGVALFLLIARLRKQLVVTQL